MLNGSFGPALQMHHKNHLLSVHTPNCRAILDAGSSAFRRGLATVEGRSYGGSMPDLSNFRSDHHHRSKNRKKLEAIKGQLHRANGGQRAVRLGVFHRAITAFRVFAIPSVRGFAMENLTHAQGRG